MSTEKTSTPTVTPKNYQVFKDGILEFESQKNKPSANKVLELKKQKAQNIKLLNTKTKEVLVYKKRRNSNNYTVSSKE